LTYFNRNGFYRYSKLGKCHYVNGHPVSRSSRSPTPITPDPVLVRFPEIRSGECSTACYVNPNARCPSCGAPVFYYQNESGSRVFFDELGPPWLKHPCMDKVASAWSTVEQVRFSAPQARSTNDISLIADWQATHNVDPISIFRSRFGRNPWKLATILKRIKSGASIYLVMKGVDASQQKKVYASCDALPRCCHEGFCVALGRRKLSFFNTSTMMTKKVGIKRFRNAATFIDAMTSSKMSGQE
jgi:hypothetical protein